MCAHPNQIKKASLIENIQPAGPLQQCLVLAGTALGSKDFAAALIEACSRPDQAPMPAIEKIELMDSFAPRNDKSNLQVPGFLHAEAVIDGEQETNFLKQLESHKIEWDVSMRRKWKH